MDRRLEDLAGRLKGVLDEVEAGRKRAEEARTAHREVARAARRALLDDLAAFGRAVGHLKVDAREDRVSFQWGSHRITFLPEGEFDTLHVRLGSVAGVADEVSLSEDEAVRVYRHPDLGHRWVLSVTRDGQEELEPLFEAGLVHLLTEGLGIPDPPPPAPSPQPPLDDLVPDEG